MTIHADSMVRTGKIVVLLGSKMVMIGTEPLYLTRKQYGILELLTLRKGETVSKDDLHDHLYPGINARPEIKIIDVFMCKLRKKIAEANDGEHYIETVWGRGYVLRDPVVTEATVAAVE